MEGIRGLILVPGADERGVAYGPAPTSAALIPVANRSLIAHALDSFRDAGLREVGVLAAPASTDALREHAGNGAAWGLRVSYLPRSGPAHAADARRVQEFADGRHVATIRGDGLLATPIQPYLEAFLGQELDALLLLAEPIQRHRHPGAAQLPARPHGLGSTEPLPALSVLAADHLALDGPPLLERTARRSFAALERLARDGCQLRTEMVHGSFTCLTDRASVLDANQLALERLLPGCRRPFGAGTVVQGAAMIDETAVVQSTTIRGPVAIGPNARVRDAYIGPYTSIGQAAQVEGVEVEDSVILPGASLKWLGERVHSSVIGEGARVWRDFALPKGLQLWLCNGAEVQLS